MVTSLSSKPILHLIWWLSRLIAGFALFLSVWQIEPYAARIKDLATLRGDRTNQLVGFSLVIGLNGTGDSEGSILSRRPLINALERLGLVLNPEDIRGRSVAAVMVTATLPAFAKPGTKIDVVVSVLGDAITLQSGILLMTPLRAANREVFAVAQGPVEDIPKGIELPASQATTGFAKLDVDPYLSINPTIGRITSGATIEKDIELELNNRSRLYMNLKQPDFTTAYRMARAINQALGENSAKAEDAGMIEISVPQYYVSQTVALVSKIENLEVVPETVAKVVIDERTGTVVMGDYIKITPVAISYKNLNLVIRDEGAFPQTAYTKEQLQREYNPPNPFANQQPGQGAVNQPNQNQAPYTGLPLPTQEKDNVLMFQGGVDLRNLVDGLNKIGVTNRDLIDIIKNIKAAGAMQAEVIIR